MRGFPEIGGPNTWGLYQYFIFSKVMWHDSSYSKGATFFIRWLKGRQRLARF